MSAQNTQIKRGVLAPSFSSTAKPGFLGDGSGITGIPFAGIKAFSASRQTGTGAAQNLAHGLGAIPSLVLAIPTDGGTVVYGAHTSTNIVVTVTAGKKFDVLAFA